MDDESTIRRLFDEKIAREIAALLKCDCPKWWIAKEHQLHHESCNKFIHKATTDARERAREIHDEITALLDSIHCPKHGMAWEECCIVEVSLELHNKISKLLSDRIAAALSSTPAATSERFMVHEPTMTVECNDSRCPVGSTMAGWPHPFVDGCMYAATCEARERKGE